MHWRDSFTCPTEDEYIEMARGSEQNEIVFVMLLTSLRPEASSVLRLSVRLMMAFSTNTNM